LLLPELYASCSLDFSLIIVFVLTVQTFACRETTRRLRLRYYTGFGTRMYHSHVVFGHALFLLTDTSQIILIEISSSMFGQLSATLTLLAAIVLANLADASTARKDFDWDIQPQKGFPTVAFNNFTTTTDIVFQYDAPLLYENKTYLVTVFNEDCETIGSNAITHLEDASVDRELNVLVDVDLGTISNSTYYKSINMTNAVIGLCLRVDYLLNGATATFMRPISPSILI
jgi:hypothetical protein